jgi:hypothetical protein
MRSRWLSVVSLLALGALLAGGCSKSSTTTSPNLPVDDQTQVNATLAASATLVDDGLAEDGSQVSANSASLRIEGTVQPDAAIRPYAWWQDITHETRTWTFVWSDSDATGHPNTVIGTLVKHMTGSLIIIPVSPADSTQPDTTRITKPIDKTLTRQIMLKRLTIGANRVWKVVEVTGAFVTTPGATTHIVSIRLQSSSGVDTTITDPLQFNSLRHVIRFGTQDSVTVTVTTTRANDAVFIHRWDWRHRLRNNLNDTYSFSWVTSAWGGWRYFGIQAMSHGSLYDDTAPFDMQAWHMPFRVDQGDVDYYP